MKEALERVFVKDGYVSNEQYLRECFNKINTEEDWKDFFKDRKWFFPKNPPYYFDGGKKTWDHLHIMIMRDFNEDGEEVDYFNVRISSVLDYVDPVSKICLTSFIPKYIKEKEKVSLLLPRKFASCAAIAGARRDELNEED